MRVLPTGAIPVPNLADDKRLERITKELGTHQVLMAIEDGRYLLRLLRQQNWILRLLTDEAEVAQPPSLTGDSRGTSNAADLTGAIGPKVSKRTLRVLAAEPTSVS